MLTDDGLKLGSNNLVSVGPNSPAVARVVSVWGPDPRREKGV